jgi:hypothetical protein
MSRTEQKKGRKKLPHPCVHEFKEPFKKLFSPSLKRLLNNHFFAKSKCEEEKKFLERRKKKKIINFQFYYTLCDFFPFFFAT